MVTNHKDAISLEESNTNSKLDTLHSTLYTIHHTPYTITIIARLSPRDYCFLALSPHRL